MKTGIELISEERKRQVDVEGWTDLHDGSHNHGELVGAAGCYLAASFGKQDRKIDASFELREPSRDKMYFNVKNGKWNDAWPWDEQYDKREKHDQLRCLVIAGALIAAEIDRLLNLPTNERD